MSTMRFFEVRFREGKRHYSDDIAYNILRLSSEGRTLVFVFPPGGGKTRALSDLVVETLSESGLSTVLRRILHLTVLQPTHKALESFSKKVIESYHDAFQRGRFGVTLPLICILRGSIESCVNPEAKKLFMEVKKVLSKAGISLSEGYDLQKKLMVEWPMLSSTEKREVMRKLTKASILGEMEMTMSTICKVCPFGRDEKTMSFISAVFRSNVDIVDSNSREAEKLLTDLSSSRLLDDDEVCSYRALLRLEFTLSEKDIVNMLQKRQIRYRKYVMLMTHSLYRNDTVCDLLNKKYRIVTSTGRRAGRVVFIDEADMLLHGAQTVKLPLHFFHRIPEPVTVDVVRRSARRYTISTNIRYLLELVDLADKFWTDIYQAAFRHGSLAEAEEVILRYLNMLYTYPTDRLSKARNSLKKWRDAVSEKIREGKTPSPEDIAVLCLCSMLLSFIDYVRRFELHRLEDVQLEKRIMFIPVTDPTSLFNIHLDYRHNIAQVKLAGLELTAIEHAVQLMLDPDYPLPYRMKLCVTATFSEEHLLRYLDAVPSDLKNELLGKDIVVAAGDVEYQNIYFRRGMFWIDSETYIQCATGLVLTVNKMNLLQRLASLGGLVAVPRKRILIQPSAALSRLLGVHGLRRASEVLLNIISEVATTYLDLEPTTRNIKVVVFTGTKPQSLILIEELTRLIPVLARRKMRYGLIEVTATSRDKNPLPDKETETAKAWLAVKPVGFKNTIGVELLISHARGRLARAVDLDEYEVAILLAPPLTIPRELDTMIGLKRSIETQYMKAAIAVEQAMFRVVRRVVYDKPKLIILDNVLTNPQITKYMSTIIRRRVERALPTPTLRLLELATK